MRLSIPIVFASVASAASSSLSSSTAPTTKTSTTATSLPDLIAQIPPCALSCLARASTNLGCAATDLTCVCRSASGSGSGASALAAQLGACILLGPDNSCNSSDLNAVKSLAPGICAQATTAESTVLSVVSTEIAGLLTDATATGSPTQTSSGAAKATDGSKNTPAAGAAPPAGTRATMALLGIGGVAVLAVYAL
ncbi:uncharacterized protein SPSK_04583 [Sporothrix schenckii 1099-18]|uniref:CFEM domain-containing protein n=1 Tax=Sporothrix schenckii 1099-18 TaxID=1397361 RepID=A0A0F2M420_SPOSC|nr:uncharacterized protein SPSK_04583 [Sporothrix schenckii 1099-18]KJR83530.1 hypothetical protein SPSK_04583 [Sporothrix schenckii 1099-18]